MLRRIFALATTLIITLSVFTASFTVSAAEECTVTVETVKAITGDEVYVALNISNNPGIMAMTISITYDPSALEYVRYYYGDVFTDYTVAAHPDRKHIRLVISERKDKTEDGTIASFKFKVADDAEVGLHEMTVEYSSGDFCNSELVRIMPVIVSGGVDVSYNGTNCSHKSFGEWTTEVNPGCTTPGVEQRLCKTCPHTENRETEKLGHDFSDTFTVDIPATKDTPGTMSQHCKRCDTTRNSTVFTLEQSDEGEIDNTIDAVVPDNEVIKDIIVQQHPDINEEASSDSSTDGTNSSNENPSEDAEQDPTKEQIKDILEILSPDGEDNEEKAETILEKLREAIPGIDNVLGIIKIALIIIFVIVLL